MLLKSKDHRVNEIMQKSICKIDPAKTIYEASVLMASEHTGSIPVVNGDGTLAGIITDRDIVIKCNALGKDIRKTKVCECMTPNPIRIVPSTTLKEAMELMSEYSVRRLPVVENEKLVGLVSVSDIAQVSDVCPNEKHPDETCILLDMARELQRTAHCHHTCK